MERQGDEVHVDDIEASGGEKTGHVRWILAIGTLLAILLLSAIWMTGAATQGDIESEVTASGKEAAREDRESIDSIVSDNADELDAAETEPGTIEN